MLLSVSPFLRCFYVLGHVKGQCMHRQKLLSPRENAAPEMPCQ